MCVKTETAHKVSTFQQRKLAVMSKYLKFRLSFIPLLSGNDKKRKLVRLNDFWKKNCDYFDYKFNMNCDVRGSDHFYIINLIFSGKHDDYDVIFVGICTKHIIKISDTAVYDV